MALEEIHKYIGKYLTIASGLSHPSSEQQKKYLFGFIGYINVMHAWYIYADPYISFPASRFINIMKLFSVYLNNVLYESKNPHVICKLLELFMNYK